MKQVSLVEYRHKSGEIHDLALREPVALTKRGRQTLVLMSFEDFMNLTGNHRRSLHPSQLTDDERNMLINSKMPKGLEDFSHEMDE